MLPFAQSRSSARCAITLADHDREPFDDARHTGALPGRHTVTDEARRAEALRLWTEGGRLIEARRYNDAIITLTRSIELFPTAEAYTFRGWAFSHQGRIDEAIAECKQAIEVDPAFGNPYNDIGAYLIQQHKYDEAIPWLERAIAAERYEARVYPWANLGRIHATRGNRTEAIRCFRKALEEQPGYHPAQHMLERLIAGTNGFAKLPSIRGR
ncbi:MAG: tetratricopeptide repeat protein [Chloroflexi bacterium]|nr:tetratricopeptide repeat protein [Chloroflexota bacterium]